MEIALFHDRAGLPRMPPSKPAAPEQEARLFSVKVGAPFARGDETTQIADER
jgi:hypothetical protein